MRHSPAVAVALFCFAVARPATAAHAQALAQAPTLQTVAANALDFDRLAELRIVRERLAAIDAARESPFKTSAIDRLSSTIAAAVESGRAIERLVESGFRDEFSARRRFALERACARGNRTACNRDSANTFVVSDVAEMQLLARETHVFLERALSALNDSPTRGDIATAVNRAVNDHALFFRRLGKIAVVTEEAPWLCAAIRLDCERLTRVLGDIRSPRDLASLDSASIARAGRRALESEPYNRLVARYESELGAASQQIHDWFVGIKSALDSATARAARQLDAIQDGAGIVLARDTAILRRALESSTYRLVRVAVAGTTRLRADGATLQDIEFKLVARLAGRARLRDSLHPDRPHLAQASAITAEVPLGVRVLSVIDSAGALHAPRPSPVATVVLDSRSLASALHALGLSPALAFSRVDAIPLAGVAGVGIIVTAGFPGIAVAVTDTIALPINGSDPRPEIRRFAQRWRQRLNAQLEGVTVELPSFVISNIRAQGTWLGPDAHASATMSLPGYPDAQWTATLLSRNGRLIVGTSSTFSRALADFIRARADSLIASAFRTAAGDYLSVASIEIDSLGRHLRGAFDLDVRDVGVVAPVRIPFTLTGTNLDIDASALERAAKSAAAARARERAGRAVAGFIALTERELSALLNRTINIGGFTARLEPDVQVEGDRLTARVTLNLAAGAQSVRIGDARVSIAASDRRLRWDFSRARIDSADAQRLIGVALGPAGQYVKIPAIRATRSGILMATELAVPALGAAIPIAELCLGPSATDCPSIEELFRQRLTDAAGRALGGVLPVSDVGPLQAVTIDRLQLTAAGLELWVRGQLELLDSFSVPMRVRILPGVDVQPDLRNVARLASALQSFLPSLSGLPGVSLCGDAFTTQPFRLCVNLKIPIGIGTFEAERILVGADGVQLPPVLALRTQLVIVTPTGLVIADPGVRYFREPAGKVEIFGDVTILAEPSKYIYKIDARITLDVPSLQAEFSGKAILGNFLPISQQTGRMDFAKGEFVSENRTLGPLSRILSINQTTRGSVEQAGIATGGTVRILGMEVVRSDVMFSLKSDPRVRASGRARIPIAEASVDVSSNEILTRHSARGHADLHVGRYRIAAADLAVRQFSARLGFELLSVKLSLTTPGVSDITPSNVLRLIGNIFDIDPAALFEALVNRDIHLSLIDGSGAPSQDTIGGGDTRDPPKAADSMSGQGEQSGSADGQPETPGATTDTDGCRSGVCGSAVRGRATGQSGNTHPNEINTTQRGKFSRRFARITNDRHRLDEFSGPLLSFRGEVSAAARSNLESSVVLFWWALPGIGEPSRVWFTYDKATRQFWAVPPYPHAPLLLPVTLEQFARNRNPTELAARLEADYLPDLMEHGLLLMLNGFLRAPGTSVRDVQTHKLTISGHADSIFRSRNLLNVPDSMELRSRDFWWYTMVATNPEWRSPSEVLAVVGDRPNELYTDVAAARLLIDYPSHSIVRILAEGGLIAAGGRRFIAQAGDRMLLALSSVERVIDQARRPVFHRYLMVATRDSLTMPVLLDGDFLLCSDAQDDGGAGLFPLRRDRTIHDNLCPNTFPALSAALLEALASGEWRGTAVEWTNVTSTIDPATDWWTLVLSDRQSSAPADWRLLLIGGQSDRQTHAFSFSGRELARTWAAWRSHGALRQTALQLGDPNTAAGMASILELLTLSQTAWPQYFNANPLGLVAYPSR